MRRSLWIASFVAASCLGVAMSDSAWGQPGSRFSLPGRSDSTAPPAGTTPGAGSTLPGSRFGSGAAESSGPASGGAFVPAPPPTTIPPPTTPPPIRPETPDTGTPVPGSAVDPSVGGVDPLRAPSTETPRYGDPLADPLADPLRGSRNPAGTGDRFRGSLDPLDDRDAAPSADRLNPRDDLRSLPEAAPRTAPAPLPEPEAVTPDAASGVRKVAYSNHLGTFLLVADGGAAHYHLRQASPQPGPQPKPMPCPDGSCMVGGIGVPASNLVPYMASLALVDSNDQHYWHYRPTHGDQFTIEWAFARKRSQDGGFAIYRKTESGWARYGSFSRRVVR